MPAEYDLGPFPVPLGELNSPLKLGFDSMRPCPQVSVSLSVNGPVFYSIWQCRAGRVLSVIGGSTDSKFPPLFKDGSGCVLTSTTVAVVMAVGETETTRRSVCPASIVRQRRVGTRKADAKSDKGLTPMSKKVNSQWLGQGFGEQDDAMPSQKLGCGDSRLTSVGATYGRLAAAEACRSRGRRCEVGTMVETF
nr:hypothetical protein Iba_chr07bCG7500 [Ipomoea batatas]